MITTLTIIAIVVAAGIFVAMNRDGFGGLLALLLAGATGYGVGWALGALLGLGGWAWCPPMQEWRIGGAVVFSAVCLASYIPVLWAVNAGALGCGLLANGLEADIGGILGPEQGWRCCV